MRLRNKPWAQELIAAHPELITIAANSTPSTWQECFPSKQPLELEIGSGKGQFIMEKARQNPQHNFLALELQTAALAMILKKQVVAQLPNLQLLQANAQNLTELFAPQSVTKLYLNFSDPWPKTRHEKRRLVAPNFLKLYQQLLVPQGQLEFKTDNRGLFEYALCSLNNFPLHLEQVSLDLHASELAAENIPTEYEDKFSQKGQPIYFLQASFPEI
ncbi:tRNA (guanosine(46)-N7)-methyltransferase TrmB [Lactobacillus sp. DCY120]|uniref:tRNA (guanine-N(7)-)-methyltransferase n=1 Tax=Bombilactobacillus apium TaxID=2675299 RepID=A0A850R1T2_9LACO|nr:tRNA (guanosine(46)-N7)-methyltransferase TrmB [Bombilactobacillus apium]NVY96883.1 tRNA (guanosine(46)-N7)-methyltransferase TrmB [Bombilactobacillus apium]